MKIENLELNETELNSLYETIKCYENSIQNLKDRGVAFPERAFKEIIKEVEQNIETITETISFEGDRTAFSSYFNAGNNFGATFDEIKEAFETNNETFLTESSFYAGVTNKINSMKSMGHKVHNVAVSSKNGVPHAEFTVTDKDHNRKRHIIHGNSSSVANLGKVRENDIDARDTGV